MKIFWESNPNSRKKFLQTSKKFKWHKKHLVISGPAAAAGLGEVRNVVHEQNERIKKLEQQISRMRLRREWGDESSQTSSSSSSTSSSSSGSSVHQLPVHPNQANWTVQAHLWINFITNIYKWWFSKTAFEG